MAARFRLHGRCPSPRTTENADHDGRRSRGSRPDRHSVALGPLLLITAALRSAERPFHDHIDLSGIRGRSNPSHVYMVMKSPVGGPFPARDHCLTPRPWPSAQSARFPCPCPSAKVTGLAELPGRARACRTRLPRGAGAATGHRPAAPSGVDARQPLRTDRGVLAARRRHVRARAGRARRRDGAPGPASGAVAPHGRRRIASRRRCLGAGRAVTRRAVLTSLSAPVGRR